MSLTSAMFTGVSGLLNQAEAMNVIGNNISNVNTVGFKGARALFSDVLSTSVAGGSQMGHGVQMQKIDNLFTQSSFESTGNATDLAIQGDSFFALGTVADKTGTPLTGDKVYYSRAGAFRLVPDTTVAISSDLYLSNPDGYRLLDTTGNPIMITVPSVPPLATDFIKITGVTSDGKITLLRGDGTTAFYNGTPTTGTTDETTAVRVGTLRIPNAAALEKVGGTLYKANSKATGVDSATTAFSATWNSTTSKATTEQLSSNSLEASNVDMANEFVKMILTQRAYSANSKTITTSDEMTQEVLNLKR